MKKRIFLRSIIILISNSSFSQIRNCGTMEHLEELKSKDVTLNKKMEKNENNLQNLIQYYSFSNNPNILTIPVVVHVVYNNSTENISTAQVQSQIDILNEDFRRLNSDASNTPAGFQSVAADCEIEFCLASIDPNGNPTTGITRTSTSQSSFSMTNNGVKFSSSGGVNAWNTSDYMNIWVCDLSSGLLGYAQFPGGPSSTDGVVCDYAYFGNVGTATYPYNLGRTATHEVGHYLNLFHIWGDSNCGNDYCNDTPQQAGENYGCPNYPSTSSCSGNGQFGDMFMNFMDYTNDACMNMFSQDQKVRMINSINSYRSGLLNSNACQTDIYGCMDPNATNYNLNANIDDGSCFYPCLLDEVTLIMTDSYGDGWNANSITINGVDYALADVNGDFTTSNVFTQYPGGYEDSVVLCMDLSTCINVTYNSTGAYQNENSWSIIGGSGSVLASGNSTSGVVSIGSCVLGCTDVTAYNFNPNATVDDGSCIAIILGCTDALAINYNASANTDDGSCTYSNVCSEPIPTGLFTSNIVHNRATINWDNMNDANCTVDQYRIKYREVGTNSWSQKNMCTPLGSCTWACNKTDKLILGLNPSTTYEYQIRAWYCGAGNSAWSSLNTFTTLDACPNVGNLTVSTPSTTKATFNWDASNGVYEFVRIKMRVDGIVNPISSDWFNVGGAGVSYPTFTKNKNNLTPGETYRAQARTWCDPNGGAYKSDTWTPLVYWTQPTIRIEGGESIVNLEVYPNPSNDVFNISFTSESIQDLRVRVLSIVGEELIVEDLQQFIGEYTKKVSLNENAKGIYFLEIETKDGVINKKLILQ